MLRVGWWVDNYLENFNCTKYRFVHVHTLQRSKMVHHLNLKLEVASSVLPEMNNFVKQNRTGKS